MSLPTIQTADIRLDDMSTGSNNGNRSLLTAVEEFPGTPTNGTRGPARRGTTASADVQSNIGSLNDFGSSQYQEIAEKILENRNVSYPSATTANSRDTEDLLNLAPRMQEKSQPTAFSSAESESGGRTVPRWLRCHFVAEKSLGGVAFVAFVVLSLFVVMLIVPTNVAISEIRRNTSVFLSFVFSVFVLTVLFILSYLIELCCMKTVFLFTVRTCAWPLYYFASSFDISMSFIIWASCSLSFKDSLIDQPDIAAGAMAEIHFYYIRTLVIVLIIAISHSFRVLFLKMWLLYLRRDAFISRLNDLNFKEIVLHRMSRAALRLAYTQRSNVLRQNSGPKEKYTRENMSLLRISPLTFVRYASSLVQDRLLMYDGTDVLAMVESVPEARKCAVMLFDAMKNAEDLLTCDSFVAAGFFPSEAQDAYHLFDAGNCGQVTVTQFVEKVSQVYTERRLLADTMNDWELGSKVIHTIFSVVFWASMILVSLMVFQIDISRLVVPLGFSAAAFSMALGSFTKDLFDSMLMVFVVCPYNVGDLVEVKEGSAPMFVEAIYVLSTKFRTLTGKALTMRNHQIAQLSVVNYRKSGIAWVSVNVKINIGTPRDKVEELRKMIAAFINSQPESWQPITEENALAPGNDDADPRQLIMGVNVESVHSWKNFGEIMTRKSKLLEFLTGALADLDIKFNQSMLPVTLLTAPPAAVVEEGGKKKK